LRRRDHRADRKFDREAPGRSRDRRGGGQHFAGPSRPAETEQTVQQGRLDRWRSSGSTEVAPETAVSVAEVKGGPGTQQAGDLLAGLGRAADPPPVDEEAARDAGHPSDDWIENRIAVLAQLAERGGIAGRQAGNDAGYARRVALSQRRQRGCARPAAA